MKTNYFYLVPILFLLLLNCESGAQKKSSNKSGGYDINNILETDYLEPQWSKDNSTLITVFKYTVDSNSKDWAYIFFYGIALLYKKVDSTNKTLAVGIIYSNGTQKGYYVLAKDVSDLSNGTITSDQFVERVLVREF